jgi:hypothetical protein
MVAVLCRLLVDHYKLKEQMQQENKVLHTLVMEGAAPINLTQDMAPSI